MRGRGIVEGYGGNRTVLWLVGFSVELEDVGGVDLEDAARVDVSEVVVGDLSAANRVSLMECRAARKVDISFEGLLDCGIGFEGQQKGSRMSGSESGILTGWLRDPISVLLEVDALFETGYGFRRLVSVLDFGFQRENV